MRRLASLLLGILCACTSAEKERDEFMLDAAEAREEGDWEETLELLESAVRTDPINLDARLRLADLYLVAYNEPEKARELYIRTRKRSLARALHGLGRCALWECEQSLGIDYLRRSLDEKPTVACAIELAARLPQDERDPILDLPLGGRRWLLFLQACGRPLADVKIPTEKTYTLARARLATGKARERELTALVADSCATASGRQGYAHFLMEESFFRRNPALLDVVKEGE